MTQASKLNKSYILHKCVLGIYHSHSGVDDFRYISNYQFLKNTNIRYFRILVYLEYCIPTFIIFI